jgi:ribonuclease-3
MADRRLDELGERLGLALHDPGALRQAFVHSSYFNEYPHDASGHNERLEFLGDAVVGLVVSTLLYERYPDEDEGFLTARRASLVNRDALAALSLDLSLDRFLLLGRGESEAGGASRPSLLAATFEALAGALYLVEGPDVTRTWLRAIFDDRLDLADGDDPPKSAKSRLQEWTQRHRRTKPSYELIGTLGPAHDQTFPVAVTLEGKRLAVGEGSSRQRAEEVAASGAMELLAADPSRDGDAAVTEPRS